MRTCCKRCRPCRRHVSARRRREHPRGALCAPRSADGQAVQRSGFDAGRRPIHDLHAESGAHLSGGSNHGDSAGRDRGAGHRAGEGLCDADDLYAVCGQHASLLVRGVRVPDDAPTPEPESEPEKEPLDARRLLQNVVLPATAGILFVIMTVLLLKVVRGGRRKK